MTADIFPSIRLTDDHRERLFREQSRSTTPAVAHGATDLVAAHLEEWNHPESLAAAPLPTFPLEVLPATVAAFADAVAIATETDPALAAVIVLGSIGTAAQSAFEVEIKPGWREPTNLFLAAFAESGTRKSTVFRVVTQPIVNWERERAKSDWLEYARWKIQREIDESRQTTLRKQAAAADGEEAVEKTRAALANAESLAMDRSPTITKLIADDVTPERLASVLAEHDGFISIMSPEGGSLFENVGGRYAKGGMPNLDTLLKAHAGDDIRVDRQGRPGDFVPRARLNIVISPQPHVAAELGRIAGFRERGGAARMLACFPASNLGYRHHTGNPVPDALRDEWAALITAVLDLDPNRTTDPDGFKEPAVLHLDADGRAELLAYQHEVEAMMRPGEPLRDLKDWGSKLPGAAVRIAALLHIAAHANNGPERVLISADTVLAALEISRYFTKHALVFFDHLAGFGGAMAGARTVWDALRAMKSPTTKRELWQRVRGRVFHAAGDLDRPLETLADLGYIRLTRVQPLGGGRPSTTIEINPHARSQNPQNPQNVLHRT